MAVKGYTDATKIQEFLDLTSLDINVDFYIEAAEQIIDNITGRNFIAQTSATPRLFNGNGSTELVMDDCVEIESVEVGNDQWGDSFTALAATDYVGVPTTFSNRTQFTEDLIPFTKIILKNRTFYSGLQNQRITAKWGYSAEVPADISFAATVIAAGIYSTERGGSAGTGAVKSEKIGNYSVSYDVGTTSSSGSWSAFTRAKEILGAYKRWYL